MPGIVGLFAPFASEAHEHTVRRMLAAMSQAPLARFGTHFDPMVGVYAGWAAHPGSFADEQSSARRPHGRALLISGECHPHEDLLDRYTTKGDGFVEALNGLFSGLIVDGQARRALLFVDRYGSERIYVAQQRGIVYFASEAKALMQVLPDTRRFDQRGLEQFLAFGSTQDGQTLFKGIRLLDGGSLWLVGPGATIERRRYFEPERLERLSALDRGGFESGLVETLARILPRYLEGGQRIGLSLTGGLDTRMILSCMARGAGPDVAYTYGAAASDTFDVRIARRLAQARNIPHHVLRVGGEFLADFAAQVDRTVLATDGCAGATGAHEIQLSEKARELAPVRLTGNWGSEVLRSMSTLRPLHLSARLFEPGMAAAVGAIAARPAFRSSHPLTRAVFEEVPWHLAGNLLAARSQLIFRTPFLDNEIVELAYRAPPTQRNSTAASLRLVHEHDPRLAAIATDRGFAWGQGPLDTIARRLFCEITFKLDYWHKEGLPDLMRPSEPLLRGLERLGLLGLHKFLPYRLWFRDELAPYLREVLTDARLARLSFLDARTLHRFVEEHASGRANRLPELNAALTLEAVDRLLLRPETK